MERNNKISRENVDTQEWIRRISFVLHKAGMSQFSISQVLLALLLIRRIDCQMIPWYKRIRNEFAHATNVDEYILTKSICGLKHFNYGGVALSEVASFYNDNVEDMFDFYVNSFDKETKEILNTLNFNSYLMQIRSQVRLILSLLIKIDLNIPMSVKINQFFNHAEMFTSNELNDIMCYYLFGNNCNKDNPILFDPCCGFGDRLLFAKDYAEKNGFQFSSIVGTDPSAISANQGKAISIICGMEDTNIESVDSYMHPYFNPKADYIISIPPFKVKFDAYSISEMEMSGIYPVGVNSTCRSELLFMQMALYYLAQDGKAAIVVPEAVNMASTTKDKEIRSWLINNDYIDSIISLPSLSSVKKTIPLCLWILDKNKAVEKKGKIAFVDLRSIVSTITHKNPNNVLWMNYIIEHCEKDVFEKYTAVIESQDIAVYNITLENEKTGKLNELLVPANESSDITNYLRRFGYDTLNISGWRIVYDKTSKEFNIDFNSLFGNNRKTAENPFDIIKEIKDSYSLLPNAIDSILSLEEPIRRTSGHSIGNWIDFVPNHWVPTSIGQIAECMVSSKPIVDEGGTLPICDVKYLRGTSEDIQYASVSEDKNTFVHPGDYVIIRSGANAGEVFEVKSDGVLGGTLLLIRPSSSRIVPKFLGYFLIAMSPSLRENSDRGIAQKNLSLKDVDSAGCYHPDMEEQRRIVDYLDAICGNIDNISNTLGVKVPKLEKIKESVIFEAVTGKIRI